MEYHPRWEVTTILVVALSYVTTAPAWAVGVYTITDLGTLGGLGSVAYGINNNGQVVGDAYTASNDYYHAFLYSNGAMTDLGTLGGTNSSASGINNNGQVVGGAYTAGGDMHAFLYSNGAMTDLGTLPYTYYSFASGINNNGQVVGGAYPAGSDQYAFLYSDGSMLDLNNLLSPGSGWTLIAANGINDLGQIVGGGRINGRAHAFLMTPVPLPTAAWLFGSGLLGLIGAARRKSKSREQSR